MTKKQDWVTTYTIAISLIGAAILVTAILSPPSDRLGLALFAVMVAVAEFGHVELFHTSRSSSVSVSAIITIAAILSLGPMAGVLIQLVSAIVNTISTHLIHREQTAPGGTSWFRRSAFNTGMFVLSTAAAGEVFLQTGGQIGNLLHVSSILPLILAATTDTLVNVTLLLIVISLQSGQTIRAIWQDNFQWAVPIMIGGGAIGGGALAAAYQMTGVLGACVFFVPIFAMGYSFRLYTSNLRDYVDKLEQANEELNQNNNQLLETLGAVIDAYDIYTLRHSAFVAEYADALAKKMGLSPYEQNKVVKAALFHDIGKIGVYDSIIGKKGALADQEVISMRRHPLIGADILRRIKGFQDLVPLVQYHHEKYDGSGYPEGLKGDAIPLGARILTLADSVEAMLTDRPYRPGYSFSYVFNEVQRCSGTHFDPQVVQAFLAVVEDKGPGFFINSAKSFESDTRLSTSEVDALGTLRFLKRSQII